MRLRDSKSCTPEIGRLYSTVLLRTPYTNMSYTGNTPLPCQAGLYSMLCSTGVHRCSSLFDQGRDWGTDLSLYVCNLNPASFERGGAHHQRHMGIGWLIGRGMYAARYAVLWLWSSHKLPVLPKTVSLLSLVSGCRV